MVSRSDRMPAEMEVSLEMILGIMSLSELKLRINSRFGKRYRSSVPQSIQNFFFVPAAPTPAASLVVSQEILPHKRPGSRLSRERPCFGAPRSSDWRLLMLRAQGIRALAGAVGV